MIEPVARQERRDVPMASLAASSGARRLTQLDSFITEHEPLSCSGCYMEGFSLMIRSLPRTLPGGCGALGAEATFQVRGYSGSSSTPRRSLPERGPRIHRIRIRGQSSTRQLRTVWSKPMNGKSSQTRPAKDPTVRPELQSTVNAQTVSGVHGHPLAMAALA